MQIKKAFKKHYKNTNNSTLILKNTTKTTIINMEKQTLNITQFALTFYKDRDQKLNTRNNSPH